MTSINFTASLIKRAEVLERQNDESYKPTKLSIVELDKNDNNDLKALYKTSILWQDQGAAYSSNIFHEAMKGYEYDNVEKEHYFALTEQKDHFEDLDHKKILGLMMFSHNTREEDDITWLQVRPNTNHSQTWKRQYKGVGKALVGLLKEVNYNKPIFVQSSDKAVEFYKKQGFVDSGDNIATSLILNV